jgi:hypothetical protein
VAILKSAVKRYLKEPREDHRWIKRLRGVDIDRALAELRPRPRLNKVLRTHQKACVYLGIAYPAFAFWLDMGTGKTLITLELLRYWYEAGVIRRAIVFVISDKAFPTWRKQIKEYEINLPYVTLEGSSAEKWEQLAQFKDGIVFVTYPGAVAMVSKRNGQLDIEKIKKLAAGSRGLVLDESTRAGHMDSLTHQLCYELRQLTWNVAYALAGRPFGRDPTMLYAQQRIIDGGETFGEEEVLFRTAFFTKEDNKHNRAAKKYVFRRRMKREMMRMAQHRSIAYSADECIDLPPFVPMVEEVRLPGEAEAYYRKVIDGIIAARGNVSEMNNAFIRMRQLSSGFLGFRNDDTGERVEVAFDENPKLERLLELVEDIPIGRKGLIFYDFTFSGRRITEELRKLGANPMWLWSGAKNAQQLLQRFEDDDDLDFAVVNNKSGAFSLDQLKRANYVFFYESPVSVIEREQAERRARRQGQLHKIFQYDLVVRGTLDQKILDYHREGNDLLQALRANPQRLLAELNGRNRRVATFLGRQV